MRNSAASIPNSGSEFRIRRSPPVNPEELTPGIVLKWLRIQAKRYSDAAQRYSETADKFNQAADVLESTTESAQNAATSRIATSPTAHATPAPHSRAFQTAGNPS